jgi:taspase (threonine aspartase 1)
MQPLDEMTTITVAENSTQSEVYFEPNDDEDKINDTVGVIVIDRMGNLATASSSGGLGMKLRGRAGPAAILGAGTAVMPADKDDPEKTMVAVVASGTGEYISSTMAATFAAERLYYSQKKIVGGKLVECDDSEVLEAFIQKEFMGKSHRLTYSRPPDVRMQLGVYSTELYNDEIYALD